MRLSLAVVALASFCALLAYRLWSAEQRLQELSAALSVHQQVALTRHNWRSSLPPASAPLPELHHYPHARTAIATLISLDALFCQVGFVWHAANRALDPQRQHDIVLYYSAESDAAALRLLEADPHCYALLQLSRLPRRRLTLPSGHTYAEGALRLINLPSAAPRLEAKNIRPQHDNWVYAMNKVAAFWQLEYDGVLFIDADALSVRPLHAFFTLEYDVALAFDQYWGCHVREELISSLYFFRPSRHLALAVDEFLDPAFTNPCKQWMLPTADQSILNCICATERADYKPYPGDVSCGRLPWFTQVQPQLLERQCVEFNASDVYVLHFGGPPKPWLGWLQEDEHKDCEQHALQATACQSRDWFEQPQRRPCFTRQAAMHSYWLCQRGKAQQRMQRILAGPTPHSEAQWRALDDVSDLVTDPCPCVLLQPLQ